MSRAIKFRAFIKKLGWVVPVEQINFDVKTVEVDLSSGQGDTSEYDFDEVELMQFTGLRDKNNKEIYEGDIFHLDDVNILYKVIWNDAGMKGKHIKTPSYVGLNYWSDDMEVIGNIYENPELLEGEE